MKNNKYFSSANMHDTVVVTRELLENRNKYKGTAQDCCCWLCRLYAYNGALSLCQRAAGRGSFKPGQDNPGQPIHSDLWTHCQTTEYISFLLNVPVPFCSFCESGIQWRNAFLIWHVFCAVRVVRWEETTRAGRLFPKNFQINRGYYDSSGTFLAQLRRN